MTTETKIRPTGHHIVVKPQTLETKTEWGFEYIAEGTNSEKLEKAGRAFGEVLAVGDQAYVAHASHLFDYAVAAGLEPSRLDPWCRVGDVVFYQKNAGKFIFDPMTGAELYLVHDEDILAVLPPYEEWEHDITKKRI
jgi:co-chaperonin GroES (HSP10)